MLAESPWANHPCDNTAFVFLTPNANTDSVAALVEKIFGVHNLTIMRDGELSCDDIASQETLAVYYSAWTRFDKKTAAKSRHFADVMEGFQRVMGGVGYTEAAKKGMVLNPTEACEVLKLTPEQLYEKWKANKNPEQVVTSGIVMKKFKEFDNKWIINGFFPALKASLEAPGKYIRWWVVQWPEKDMEWYQFRDKVIGNKDLKKARSESIRGVLVKEWKSLGLATEPDLLENGVHGSGGPLEGFTERIAFTGVPPLEDELGAVIKNRYDDFGMDLATQWSANNRISLNDEPFRPAYDVCENFQTSDFLDTIEQNLLNDDAYLKFKEKQARAPWADYPFLDREPEGISIEIVWPYLIEDNPFKRQDHERNKMKKLRKPDPKLMKACEVKMNERNHAIAKCLKLWPFLDQMPEGLSLATVIVYLVEDPEFKIFDKKRIALLKDPQRNAAAIKQMEEKMNERNHEVAKVLKAWPFLHPMPEGIPLNVVLPQLMKDREFLLLDKERLALMKDPTANEAKIKEVEKKMDERNHIIAKMLKGGWPFLDPFPEDIPLQVVLPHLTKDPEFLRLDEERLRLIDEDYFKNYAKIKATEEAMNERSHVLARILKKWPFLDTLPEGIPIDSVMPYLLKDKAFLDYDVERIDLNKDPTANAKAIKDKEEAMNERNHAIARALKEYPFLDPMPEGLVLAFVLKFLKHDPDFLRYDEERVNLMKDPKKNAKRIRELELLMDERNHIVAKALKDWPFLHPMPEGILLANVLPVLTEDPEFLTLDKERLRLLNENPTANAEKVRAIEKAMDERSHAIARTMTEYAFLSQRPEGLTLAAVLPHLKASDPQFKSMDQQRKALIAKNSEDPAILAKIKEYEEKMNVRNHTMAKILKDYQFLDKVPQGLALATVFPYLMEDPKFQRYDKERLFLRRTPESIEKHAVRILQLEVLMNERNHFVAKGMKEWPFLEPMCGDVLPLAVMLEAVADRKVPEFTTMITRRKKFLKDPLKNQHALKEAEKAMDAYLAEVAVVVKKYPYLDPFPEGMPLTKLLPDLEQLDEFLSYKYERAELLKGQGAAQYEIAVKPEEENWQGHSEYILGKIEGIEAKLNEISVRVAYDYYAFLTQTPEELKLRPTVLPTLKLDYFFAKRERKRRYVRAKVNARRIKAANEEAVKRPPPDDKPLSIREAQAYLYLPSTDPDDVERQKDVYRLEAMMDERNFEAAKALKYRPYLNKEPEGIALSMVMGGIHDDPEFAKADAEMIKLLGPKYYSNEDPLVAFAKREAAAMRMEAKVAALSDSSDEDDVAANGNGSKLKSIRDPTRPVDLPKVHQPPTKEAIAANPKLKQLIATMNMRCVGLASAVKEYPFLDLVPVKDPDDGDALALDTILAEVKQDAEFATLDKERRVLLTTGSDGTTTAPDAKDAEFIHEDAIDAIELKMRDRCRFLAKVIYERIKLMRPDEEYPFLSVLPEGIPVRKVIPYLKQDIEFMACDTERLALIADNKDGKWNDATKGLEEQMNARNHAIAATLKHFGFLDQFPEGIALTYVLPHLKIDPAFAALNEERLALLKAPPSANSTLNAANEARIKETQRLMNERNHAVAKAMKGYPFLDVMPEGIPLDVVFPVLVHDEEFKDCDAKRLSAWAALPDEDCPRGTIKVDAFGWQRKKVSEEVKQLEHTMNVRNHEVAKAMKLWPFLDQMPEGLLLAIVLSTLVLDAEFQRLDKERIPLLSDPTKNAAIIATIQKKMNDRNLAVARGLKAYPFLDPRPHGIPVTTVIPFLERDDKVFVPLNKQRLELMKDPKGNAEIKKVHAAMNARSYEYAAAMLAYPFLDPMPEGIPLPYVLPLLKTDEQFIALEKERQALLDDDPVKNAAKVADLEVAMNERNLAVARMLKQYPFLHPLPEGLPLSYVLPILLRDDVFLALDAKRIQLCADPIGNADAIKALEQEMDARSHAIARMLKDYPFLDPLPEGVILSLVLPLLTKDASFMKLEQERLELISKDSIANADAIKACEVAMNDRSHEIAKLIKGYPFLDPLPHGLPLSLVFPVLKHDELFAKYDAERLSLLGTDAASSEHHTTERIKELEGLLNERNLAVALAMSEYPFLDPLPEGLPITKALPVLKHDEEFIVYDKERLELMELDPIANAARIRELELLMDERNHAIAKILKLLMDEYPFLTPFPEGLSLACVVWPHLSVDPEFCDTDVQRRLLVKELLDSPSSVNDSRKRDKVMLLEQLMDDRNHAIARMLKEAAARRNARDDGKWWSRLPAGLIEAILREPFKRRAFPRIEAENAADDPDRWIDVDFKKRTLEVDDWCRIGELYEGPKVGDTLLPPLHSKEDLHVSQFEHGLTPECFFHTAIAAILQHDPTIIRKLFVSKHVRQDGRYTFQFFKWDRWVRVEIDDTIPMVRDDPIYTRSLTGHWWPLLLEKAYAKFYGSYDNIQQGSVAEAIQDMCGIPVMSAPLSERGTVLNTAVDGNGAATEGGDTDKGDAGGEKPTAPAAATDDDTKASILPAHPKLKNTTRNAPIVTSSATLITNKYLRANTWSRLADDIAKRRSIVAITANSPHDGVLLDGIIPNESYCVRKVHVMAWMDLNDNDGPKKEDGSNDTTRGAHRRAPKPPPPAKDDDEYMCGNKPAAVVPAPPPTERKREPSVFAESVMQAEEGAVPLHQDPTVTTNAKGTAFNDKNANKRAGAAASSSSPRQRSSADDDDLSHILLELYNPYRKATYGGPYRKGDAELWTSEVKAFVKPRFEEAPYVIYVPLEDVIASFTTIHTCMLGTLRPEPYHFTEAWTKATAGGNANNHKWRTNPIYPIKNASNEPMTIVAQIKQPDQRERQDILRAIKDGTLMDNGGIAKGEYLRAMRQQQEAKLRQQQQDHGGGGTASGAAPTTSTPSRRKSVKDVRGSMVRHGSIYNFKLFRSSSNVKGGGNTGGGSSMRRASSIHGGMKLVGGSSRQSVARLGGFTDERSDDEGDYEVNLINYNYVGLTLVEQLPPPQVSEADCDLEQDFIRTHLLTPNAFRFIHRGTYMMNRDVANEIIIPPRSQCYLVPSTFDVGTIGSFMFSVFIPKNATDESIEMAPVDRFPPLKVSTTLEARERRTFLFEVNVRGVLRTEECQTAEELKKASNTEADEGNYEDVHLLLKQDKAASMKGIEGGDTLMDDYVAVVVQGPMNPLLGGGGGGGTSSATTTDPSSSSSPNKQTPTVLARPLLANTRKFPRLDGSMQQGMNYREVSAVFRATQSGTYAVTIVRAKPPATTPSAADDDDITATAAGTAVPVTLSVHSFPGLTNGLRADGAPMPKDLEVAIIIRRRGDEIIPTFAKLDGTDVRRPSTMRAGSVVGGGGASSPLPTPPTVGSPKRPVQPPPGVLLKKAVAPPPRAVKKMVAGGGGGPSSPPAALGVKKTPQPPPGMKPVQPRQ